MRPALPAHLADLFDRPERTERVATDLEAVEAVVERVTLAAGLTGSLRPAATGR